MIGNLQMNTGRKEEKENIMNLLKHEKPSEYCDVVNKTTDPDELHNLALKSGLLTKVLIAKSPYTSVATLEYLVRKDPDRKYLWQTLVKNPELTGDNLAWIYEQVTRVSLVSRVFPFAKTDTGCFHEATLKAIAVHPNSPIQIIHKLSRDKSPYVRFEVSKNSELTLNQKKSILDNLIDTKGAGDSKFLVEVLSHPDLHRSIRNVVINGMVNEEKKKESEDIDYRLLNAVAGFNGLDPEIVKYLASIENLSIGSKVLLNNNSPKG